ncbi:SRPBCC family protein [Nocardioides sp. YIM 152315]|uniref:SRPBCC family protein n=1 Tax=Nocardioides sp. YIM 152315 TaxID=3031760 RepID=UPI0023DA5C23|nr:SRPBCC family protein [Nocardioides sp. YIM 152315]MDF1602519.1 SRPBCC family protein [Nocardioides sp. YIM 152315]
MATSSDAGGRLKSAGEDLFKTLGDKAVGSIGDRMGGLTDRLEDVASGNSTLKAALGSGKSAAKGDSPVKGALKGAASAVKDKVPGLGGGGGGSGSGGSGKATKATNIIEQVDVGVPVDVAYNQWTEFGGFPSFMKKVENVDADEDNKLEWKAQIVWSHRHWQATILEQVPDERIVWRSEGEKGHVDGAVTFHELGPNLTRIIVVLEYYPQGLFERTGNLWRAQGRRARAELKHFQRHVMTRTILEPDEVEGWRGRIEDSEVVESHEEALEQEEAESEEPDDEYEDEEAGDEEAEDEPEDEYEEAEDEPEDEPEDEDEPEEEPEEEPEDEYEDEYEEAPEEAPEDEYEDEYEDEEEPEPEEEPQPRSRRKRAS